MATALGAGLAEGLGPTSWWWGLPIMAATTFLASLPLALFPTRLPGAPPEPAKEQIAAGEAEERSQRWQADWLSSWRGLGRLLSSGALLCTVWANLHVTAAVLGFRYLYMYIGAIQCKVPWKGLCVTVILSYVHCTDSMHGNLN